MEINQIDKQLLEKPEVKESKVEDLLNVYKRVKEKYHRFSPDTYVKENRGMVYSMERIISILLYPGVDPTEEDISALVASRQMVDFGRESRALIALSAWQSKII